MVANNTEIHYTEKTKAKSAEYLIIQDVHLKVGLKPEIMYRVYKILMRAVC